MRTFLILLILVVLPMAVSADVGFNENEEAGWQEGNNQARVLGQTSVGELPQVGVTEYPSNPYINQFRVAGACIIHGVGQNAIAVQLMICLGVNPVGGGIIMLTAADPTPCPCESENR